MQIVLVYLQPFRRNSLLKCVAAWNREKFTRTPYFWGSRLFRISDVDFSKELVGSACYDKQHACVYMQTFSP